MGLFNFFKKEKNDVEKYYEERKNTSSDVNFNLTPNDVYMTNSFLLQIDDVFALARRGTVVTGKIQSGTISVGDTVQLKRVSGMVTNVTITGIEKFRKMYDTARTGEAVGLLLKGITKEEVGKGDLLIE